MGWLRAYVSHTFVLIVTISNIPLLYSMLKNVKGQSEEDNRKRQVILDEILNFFKTQARKA